MKVSYTSNISWAFGTANEKNVVVGATSADDGSALSLTVGLSDFEDDGAFAVMTTMTSLVLGLAAMAF